MRKEFEDIIHSNLTSINNHRIKNEKTVKTMAKLIKYTNKSNESYLHME